MERSMVCQEDDEQMGIREIGHPINIKYLMFHTGSQCGKKNKSELWFHIRMQSAWREFIYKNLN
ncbi:MAG: hypothetical protein C0403_03690 [Desulfobacterium sp.]|nr:hypothetical protein [Desulfobacterium sp.]